MNLPQGYARVDVGTERRHEMHAVDQWAFATSYSDEVNAQVDAAVPWTRARAIEVTDGPDAGTFAAVHGSFGHQLRVPGGTVAAAGLTWVGVHPAHRRRGLLRAMIDEHVFRSRARGEAVSTLYAAETAIYQRFGYGMACWGAQVTLPRGGGLAPVPGSDDLRVRLEDADFGRHAAAVRAVLLRDQRPGIPASCPDEMLAGIFLDPEQWREGKERRRIAIVEDAAGPVAYALFQREAIWDNSQPRGKGFTKSWAAATGAAERRLWSVVADLDLMASFTVSAVPIDSPLVSLSQDPRGLNGLLRDQLWLRIVDVQAALEARTYLADADLTIAVGDHLVAENDKAWRVVIADGRASVTRAERDARVDLTLSIGHLSAAYLGGVSLDGLAAAGFVQEGSPGAVSTFSDALRSRLAPRSPWIF